MINVTMQFADAQAMVDFFRAREAAAPSPAPKAAPAPAPKAAAAKAPSPARAAPAAIEYSVLQKAVFELAAKNTDAVMAVLAGLDVKSAKELPAARYQEALDAVKAKLAELNAVSEVA